MPTWLDDPVVRLRIAKTLRWSELVTSAAGVLLLYGFTRLPMISSVSWATIVGMILVLAVVAAAPAAVYEIVVMDRDGRLDQLRLSGRSPARLLVSTVVASAGVQFVIALALLSVWRAATGRPIDTVAAVVAVIAGSLALAQVALAIPRRSGRGDLRQTVLAVGLLLLFGAAVASDRQVMELTDLDSVGAHLPSLSISGLPIALLTLALLSVALTRRAALRAMAYPATRESRPRAPLLQLRQIVRHPDLYRGLAATLLPAALVAALTAVVGAGLLGAALSVDWQPKTAALYAFSFLPLAAGALVISLLARDDLLRGRLDVLRIGPMRGVGRLLMIVGSYWAPFALITVTIHAIVAVTTGGSAQAAAATLLVLLVVAPLALMEGWDGSAPAFYTMPVVSLLAILLFGFDSSYRDPWRHPGLLGALVISWIPWLCTLRTWQQPGRPPLAGWAGPLAVACLAIAALQPEDPAIWERGHPLGTVFFAVALLGSVGFFLAPAPAPAPNWWIPLAAASATSGVMVWVRNRGTAELLIAVLAPALAWLIGVRLHRWIGSRIDMNASGFRISRSITFRVVTAGVVAVGSERLAVLLPSVAGAGLSGGQRQQAFCVALLAAAGLVVETIYRARAAFPLRVRRRLTA